MFDDDVEGWMDMQGIRLSTPHLDLVAVGKVSVIVSIEAIVGIAITVINVVVTAIGITRVVVVAVVIIVSGGWWCCDVGGWGGWSSERFRWGSDGDGSRSGFVVASRRGVGGGSRDGDNDTASWDHRHLNLLADAENLFR